MGNSDMSTQTFRILFVDNSRTSRAVMSRLLSAKGYSVTTIGTGVEAVDKLKTEQYDLAIMDLFMPVMNGYEAAKIIRSCSNTNQDTPIIALTASQDPKDIELCKSVGMNEYVIKSEDNKDLFEAIEHYNAKPK